MRATGVRGVAVLVASAVVSATAGSGAGAAVTIGDLEPGTSTGCGLSTGIVQAVDPAGRSYVSPIDGVITSFTFEGPGGFFGPQDTKLLVLEPAGSTGFGPTEYRVVAASGFETADTEFRPTRPARVPILAGQTIGPYGYACAVNAPANGGAFRSFGGPEPAVGSTQTYGAPQAGRLMLQATVEPDCDRDGLGDETQDADLSPCPPAPSATITKAPKDKTKKKQATFEFSASEPGASFTCVLDGKQQFKACTSPLTVKVKKGRHTFSVIAADAGGNAGAAATDDWKVKKKKKKRRR